jgi:precorrin-6B methylase 2
LCFYAISRWIPVNEEAVRACIHRLFIGAPGTTLRREDSRKATEVVGFLKLLQPRVNARTTLVDAAAGRSSLGLLAMEFLNPKHLTVIERDPERAQACREAVQHLARGTDVTVHCGDVGDAASWPTTVGVVAALHACGAASDAILDAAILSKARWIVLVPCCYAETVPFAKRALERVEAMGASDHAAIRRPLVQSLIDHERTLRAETAGYDVTVVSFVAPTVTPHNLAWVCRRVREPNAMAAARARWEALW